MKTITRHELANPGVLRPYYVAVQGKARYPDIYSFETQEERDACAERLEAEQREHDAQVARRRAARKAARSAIVNPFSPGDILYNSWGYDQTNVDWYQVTATTARTVTIRPIGGKLTDADGCGPMAGYTVPCPNNFTGPQVRKTLQVYTDHQGKPAGEDPTYIPTRHGSMSRWTPGDKPVYCSWYH